MSVNNNTAESGVRKSFFTDVNKCKGDFEKFQLTANQKQDNKFCKDDNIENMKDKNRSGGKKMNKDTGKVYSVKDNLKW